MTILHIHSDDGREFILARHGKRIKVNRPKGVSEKKFLRQIAEYGLTGTPHPKLDN